MIRILFFKQIQEKRTYEVMDIRGPVLNTYEIHRWPEVSYPVSIEPTDSLIHAAVEVEIYKLKDFESMTGRWQEYHIRNCECFTCNGGDFLPEKLCDERYTVWKYHNCVNSKIFVFNDRALTENC